MDDSLSPHCRKGTGSLEGNREQGAGNRDPGGLPAIAHQDTRSRVSSCGYVDNRADPEPLDVDGFMVQLTTIHGKRHDIIRTGERIPISWPTRLAVLQRDGNRCKRCSEYTRHKVAHLDHIKPWSAGGSDRTHNLRTLCPDCNIRRSNFQDGTDDAELTPATWWCTGCTDTENATLVREVGAWLLTTRPDHQSCWSCQQEWWQAVDDSRYPATHLTDERSPFGITDYAADPVLAYCVHCDSSGYTHWPL